MSMHRKFVQLIQKKKLSFRVLTYCSRFAIADNEVRNYTAYAYINHGASVRIFRGMPPTTSRRPDPFGIRISVTATHDYLCYGFWSCSCFCKQCSRKYFPSQWNREGSQILWIDPRINISVYGVLKNWATSFRINVCTSINIAIYFISTQHHRSGSVIKTVGVLNVRILT